MQIRNKQEFYCLWSAGLLGNKPHTWETADELAASGFAGKVGIRSKVKGGPCLYHLPVEEVLRRVQSWPCAYSLSEAMPDHLLLIQGELQRQAGGLVLTYSCERGITMRQAMERPLTAVRVNALRLLREHLWPSSCEDMDDLFDLYPDAVVEFNAYECAVGTLPHRNAVIWEVRDY